MLKQWDALSDQEKIEALKRAVDRLRTEVAETGVEARSAKAIAETVAKAMMVLEKRLVSREPIA